MANKILVPLKKMIELRISSRISKSLTGHECRFLIQRPVDGLNGCKRTRNYAVRTGETAGGQKMVSHSAEMNRR
jgi:hypothetical protein